MRSARRLWVGLVGLSAASLALSQAPLPRAPKSELDLRLEAPIRTWDEGLPIGNGLLGGLVWGGETSIQISLDRGDLWDIRRHPTTRDPGFTYDNWRKLVKARNTAELQRLFDDPYDYGAPPTKLPAGRLRFWFPKSLQAKQFHLSLADAEAVVQFTNDARARAMYCDDALVGLIELSYRLDRWELIAPGAVNGIGHTRESTSENGDLRWYWNAAPEQGDYGVVAQMKIVGDRTLVAWTIESPTTNPRALEAAKSRVQKALDRGYEAARSVHARWWKRFWSASAVALPDSKIAQQYAFVQYLYGAGSRPGAPPIPLQGVWTADNGGLPPWKGDYHNDLNTQMTYMGYQEAGRFDAGRGFFDFNSKLLPEYRRFCKSFYGVDGALAPGVMALDGAPLTGWPQYALSPTMSAWIGQLYCRHWRFTQDRDFLERQAYPWCRETGRALQALLVPDASGRLVLPLSSSPEINDNALEAYLTPNSNFDLMALKALFSDLESMAKALGKSGEAAHWKETLDRLGEFHTSADGALLIAAGLSLPGSHRHLSNLMAIYPFESLTVEDGPRAKLVIEASLAQWDKTGTSQWCGYSFSWMSALKARVGDAEGALKNLEIFCNAFLLRNGFHANGDQSGKGYSSFTYRPFTLEGNMLACAAVHEALLQSWRPNGRDESYLRIFPAVSERWTDVGFDDLRSEDGHRVSARRVGGQTTWVQIHCGKSGVLKVRAALIKGVEWNRAPVTTSGDWVEFRVRKGDTLSTRPAKVSF